MKIVKLTQRKEAIVDDCDFEKVSRYKWHYVNAYTKRENGYARYRLYENGKPIGFIRMHHLVLPPTKGYIVDHINGSGLDNRRGNLRLVTQSQNMMNAGPHKNNTSGYKGIYWMKKMCKWKVSISKNREQYHIGCYTNKYDAVKAYNQAAKIHHGEYAFLNKI